MSSLCWTGKHNKACILYTYSFKNKKKFLFLKRYRLKRLQRVERHNTVAVVGLEKREEETSGNGMDLTLTRETLCAIPSKKKDIYLRESERQHRHLRSHLEPREAVQSPGLPQQTFAAHGEVGGGPRDLRNDRSGSWLTGATRVPRRSWR